MVCFELITFVCVVPPSRTEVADKGRCVPLCFRRVRVKSCMCVCVGVCYAPVMLAVFGCVSFPTHVFVSVCGPQVLRCIVHQPPPPPLSSSHTLPLPLQPMRAREGC